MKYDDLLSFPYEDNGRFGKTRGLDCYGVVLEMCKRNGTPLKDIVYPTSDVEADKFGSYYRKINVTQIDEKDARAGDLVQCEYHGNLHIAFMLSRDTVIHATTSGVRVSSLNALNKKRYMRVL